MEIKLGKNFLVSGETIRLPFTLVVILYVGHGRLNHDMMSRPKRVRKESGLREKEKEFTLTLSDEKANIRRSLPIPKYSIAKPSIY